MTNPYEHPREPEAPEPSRGSSCSLGGGVCRACPSMFVLPVFLGALAIVSILDLAPETRRAWLLASLGIGVAAWGLVTNARLLRGS